MTIKMVEEILGRVRLYEAVTSRNIEVYLGSDVYEKEQEWLNLQSDLVYLLDKILVSQLEPVRPQYRSYHQGLKK